MSSSALENWCHQQLRRNIRRKTFSLGTDRTFTLLRKTRAEKPTLVPHTRAEKPTRALKPPHNVAKNIPPRSWVVAEKPTRSSTNDLQSSETEPP